jgi:DNA-binding cell septation regulator SpoVG
LFFGVAKKLANVRRCHHGIHFRLPPRKMINGKRRVIAHPLGGKGGELVMTRLVRRMIKTMKAISP